MNIPGYGDSVPFKLSRVMDRNKSGYKCPPGMNIPGYGDSVPSHSAELRKGIKVGTSVPQV
jgi:hypothetical protein